MLTTLPVKGMPQQHASSATFSTGWSRSRRCPIPASPTEPDRNRRGPVVLPAMYSRCTHDVLRMRSECTQGRYRSISVDREADGLLVQHRQPWATFLRHHAGEIWACDFLPITDLLFRPLHAFFVIVLETRRVIHVGVTRQPTDAWVAQQLREATPFGQRPIYLLRDNDSKYGAACAHVAAASGITVLRTAYRAPRQNATCARFLGSVRRECLDHLLILGQAQLRRVLRDDVQYFNYHRPHQGLAQRIPAAPRAGATAAVRDGSVRAIPILHGLHHAYARAA